MWVITEVFLYYIRKTNKRFKGLKFHFAFLVLCQAVLTVVHNCYLFVYMQCLGSLCYNFLYALSLHGAFAHLQVPFSLGVSQKKRG